MESGPRRKDWAASNLKCNTLPFGKVGKFRLCFCVAGLQSRRYPDWAHSLTCRNFEGPFGLDFLGETTERSARPDSQSIFQYVTGYRGFGLSSNRMDRIGDFRSILNQS